MKQDRNGVRTPQDLERKYDLASLVGIKKAIRQSEEGINKTNAILEEFMRETLEGIESLQSQVDGNITTYFYSGVPTMNNAPANEWGNYEVHLGDLYYDNDTGAGYRFVRTDDGYGWSPITDSAVTEALALANKAQDTADGKRRVFVVTPIPPYDEGDLWINAQELYVCVKAKATGSYAEGDFKKAVKYTDDSALNSFVEVTYKEAIKEINAQIDNKITTWFASGEPTASNYPANSWHTEELKKAHTGDMYYDKDTGFAYRYDSSYKWVLIKDKDTVDALAIANESKDTADGKRRVFVATPYPPYDEGDLWINEKELYVCVNTKTEGSYAKDDFQKAVKYTDDSALNTFVNLTYNEAIKSINAQLDNKITTWYHSGKPTTSNHPAIDWNTVALKKAHIGDMYYDKDTGFAYRYDIENGAYKWMLIKDKDTTEALALANASKDTADGKRRVFTETPYPPYDNGDLWFHNKEIYICQISKPETESYEEADFIIATKYTDDTYAKKVGDDLVVLEGTVLEIKESTNEFKASISKKMGDAEREISTLQLTTNSFETRIKGNENAVASLKLTTEELTATVKDASKVATSFLNFDASGLQVGNIVGKGDNDEPIWSGYRTRMGESFDILDENGLETAKFQSHAIHLGMQGGEEAVIDMLKGAGKFYTTSEGGLQAYASKYWNVYASESLLNNAWYCDGNRFAVSKISQTTRDEVGDGTAYAGLRLECRYGEGDSIAGSKFGAFFEKYSLGETYIDMTGDNITLGYYWAENVVEGDVDDVRLVLGSKSVSIKNAGLWLPNGKSVMGSKADGTDLMNMCWITSADNLMIGGGNYMPYNIYLRPDFTGDVKASNDGNWYSLLGAAKSLAIAYTMSCTPKAASGWGNVSASAFLVGSCLRVSIEAKRNSSPTVGNVTNEDVMTIKLKSEGKIKTLFRTGFAADVSGGVATFSAQASKDDENGNFTITIKLCATTTGDYTYNGYFVMPAELKLSAFI